MLIRCQKDGFIPVMSDFEIDFSRKLGVTESLIAVPVMLNKFKLSHLFLVRGMRIPVRFEGKDFNLNNPEQTGILEEMLKTVFAIEDLK